MERAVNRGPNPNQIGRSRVYHRSGRSIEIQASGSSCATRDRDRWKAIRRGRRGGAIHKATRRGRETAISHGHSRAHARMRSRILSRIHVDSRLSAAAIVNTS